MMADQESNAQSEAQPSRSGRKPGETWQGFVERQIQEAQARGLFDNLPGHGEPLRLEPLNPYEGDRELAHKLLRDHGFAPEWIELDKEIRDQLDAARRRLAQTYRQHGPASAFWSRAVQELAGQIADLNRKIDLYNLQVPVVQLQRRRIQLADELQRAEQGDEADG